MIRKMFGLILLSLMSAILIGCSANYRLAGEGVGNGGGNITKIVESREQWDKIPWEEIALTILFGDHGAQFHHWAVDIPRLERRYSNRFFRNNVLVIYVQHRPNGSNGIRFDGLRVAGKELIMDVTYFGEITATISTTIVIVQVSRSFMAGANQLVINEMEPKPGELPPGWD